MKSSLIKSLAIVLAASLAGANLPPSAFAQSTVIGVDALPLPASRQAPITAPEFQLIVSGQLAQFDRASYAAGLNHLIGSAGTPSKRMSLLFPQEASARTLLLLLISEKTSQRYGHWISQRRLRRKLGAENYSAVQEMNREFLLEMAKEDAAERKSGKKSELRNLALSIRRGFPLGENRNAHSIEAIERDLNKFFDNSITDWLKIQERQPVWAAARSMFSWPQALRLKKSTQEPLASKLGPRPTESVEQLFSKSGTLPHAAETIPKMSLVEKLHAFLSIAYSTSLLLFSGYRLLTEEARYAYYREIAQTIHRHQRHSWTFWEKFNLGGLNDLMTPAACLAIFYLAFSLLLKKPQEHESYQGLRMALTLGSIILGIYAALTLSFSWRHGTIITDYMNLATYSIGGIFAGLVNYLLWLPKPHKTELPRNEN